MLCTTAVTGILKISYFFKKTYVVGTHQKHLGEALLISTPIICFHQGIRNNIHTFWLKNVLSGAKTPLEFSEITLMTVMEN